MKNYLKYLLIVPILLFTKSCESWLDVNPRDQIEAGVLFERESGFKDALIGIYINMTSTAMYGREMTFGMVDLLGSVYTSVGGGNTTTYGALRLFDFTHSGAETVINNVWMQSYNTIANINNLIQHLHAADRSMFQRDNFNVILGEALALRAFIHFDLLRLFAPSYLAGPNALAIPYVVTHSFQPTPFSTVSETIDKILADLREATYLLRESDPIHTGRQITIHVDEGFLMNRQFRKNYYATLATMARVYLWRGDLMNAGRLADEVIAGGSVRWTTADEISHANIAMRDFTFSAEQIFVLQILSMEMNIRGFLQMHGYATGNMLIRTLANNNALFTDINDWRLMFFWEAGMAANPNARFNNKFYQREGMPNALRGRMPIIRLPEMFLISAEVALLNGDLATARERLSTIHQNRGMGAATISPTATAEELRLLITREYQREFIGEGVLFYYYKRLNFDREDILNAPVEFERELFVVPIPMSEIEFR